MELSAETDTPLMLGLAALSVLIAQRLALWRYGYLARASADVHQVLLRLHEIATCFYAVRHLLLPRAPAASVESSDRSPPFRQLAR